MLYLSLLHLNKRFLVIQISFKFCAQFSVFKEEQNHRIMPKTNMYIKGSLVLVEYGKYISSDVSIVISWKFKASFIVKM